MRELIAQYFKKANLPDVTYVIEIDGHKYIINNNMFVYIIINEYNERLQNLVYQHLAKLKTSKEINEFLICIACDYYANRQVYKEFNLILDI